MKLAGRSDPAAGALRKVITVNTADLGGGAERLAWQMFEGCAAQGLDSWFLVGDKKSSHERVMPFYLSPYFDYRPFAGTWTQRRQRTLKWLCRRAGLDDFEFPYSRHLLELTGSVPDVVHCHNLHGGYFDLRALPWLSRRVPVFLTLQDAWTATGHCAFPIDCERWQRPVGCGQCPDLNLPPAVERDATSLNWWRKARIFENSRLYVIGTSQWSLDLARRSILAPAMADARLIPNGVDLSVFHPGDRGAARADLPLAQAGALPMHALLMISVAHAGAGNPFKDWPTLKAALERLTQPPPTAGGDRPLHLAVIGGKVGTEKLGPVTVHHLGYLPHVELARYYRAADLFVHAPRAETFGLVIAEAMACGLPAVVSAVGPTPEVAVPGQGGILVRPRDPDDLARQLQTLIAKPEMLPTLGDLAAQYAQRHFDARQMVGATLDFYQDVVAQWQAERGDYVSRALHL